MTGAAVKIREIVVSGALVSEFFRDGYKAAHYLTNGLPEGYCLFDAHMDHDGNLRMRFAPGKTAIDVIDDTTPVLHRVDPVMLPAEEGVR